jgi:Protein of unknown function (DUF4239)
MSLLVMAIVIVGACLLMVALLLLIRRGPRPVRDLGSFGALVTGVGALFGVLLAFVIVLAFEDYDDAQSAAAAEANNALRLFREAVVLPAPQGPRAAGAALCYARAVTRDEWPRLARGQTPRYTGIWTLALERAPSTFALRTEREAIAASEFTRALADRGEARATRTLKAGETVPAPILFVLILGAAATLVTTLLFADPAERLGVQIVGISAVTAVLVGAMLLLAAFNNPYGSSDAAVEPTAMAAGAQIMNSEVGLARPPIPVLCDSVGAPRPGAA